MHNRMCPESSRRHARLYQSRVGNLYERLNETCEKTDGRWIVYSAFCERYYTFEIKSAQNHLNPAKKLVDVVRLRQVTSSRQAEEWEMLALKGSFSRLKDRMVYEERQERRIILVSVVKLFNFRARLVGINQMLSLYMPHLGPEANRLFFLRDSKLSISLSWTELTVS